MKKIFIVLFIVSILVQVKVFASQTLVTTEGLLDDSYLQEDDKQLLESNVNWNLSGSYQVEYYDQITKEFIQKEVIVTNKDDLKQGINSFKSESIIDTTNQDICRILYISENEYLVYGSINPGYRPYQGIYYETFGYVSYYKNGNLSWSKTINDQRYGNVNSAVVTKRGIAILGDYDSLNQGRNTYIIEYSLDGKILFQKELNGSKDDFGYKLFYDNDLLYFVGLSYSSNEDYLHNAENNDCNIVVGSVSPNVINSLNLVFIGNDGNETYYDAIYSDKNIYVLMKFEGNGYFSSTVSKYQAIISIDYRLTIGHWTNINQYDIYVNSKLSAFNGQIGVAGVDRTTNRIRFINFDNRLEYLSVKIYKIDDMYRISYFNLYQVNDSLIITSLIKDPLDKEYNYISILNEDYIVKQSSISPNSYSNTRSLNIYQDPIGKIYITNWVYNEEYLEIKSFTNYQLYENIKEFTTWIFYENTINVNTNPIDYKLIEYNVGSNPYGLYSNLYSFDSGDLEIVINMDVFYFPRINVESKEIYDIDLKLKFNGVGYLNNEEIDNNHCITEAGLYVLEINGENGEKEVVTFSVKEISENITIPEVEKEEVEIYFNDTQDEEREELNLVDLELDIVNYENEIPFEYYIIIGSIFLGVILGIFVPIKKIIKGIKHV